MYGKKCGSKHFNIFFFTFLSQLSCFFFSSCTKFPNLVPLHHDPELKVVHRPPGKGSEYLECGFRVKSVYRVSIATSPYSFFQIIMRRSVVTRQPCPTSLQAYQKLRSVKHFSSVDFESTRWQCVSTVDLGFSLVLLREWEVASGDERSSAY